jgi:hypothetical protein
MRGSRIGMVMQLTDQICAISEKESGEGRVSGSLRANGTGKE